MLGEQVLFSNVPHQEHGLDETFDSITPHLTKSKAIIIKSKHANALAKLLGAENPTGRLCTFCFLLLTIQTFLSISLFFFFLGKNHNALMFFFFHGRLYTLYTMKKKKLFCLIVFDCSNASCLQPLNHKTKKKKMDNLHTCKF